MATDRRKFIKQTAGTMLAGIALTDFVNAENSKIISSNGMKIESDDEKFWSMVRQQFPLTKDVAYLNNGTMGPSPYPVIEAVRKGMMDCDQLGSYGGWER